MDEPTVCSVEDCDGPARESSFCWWHWARWSAHGDPLSQRIFYRKTEREYLLSKVREDPETGCWLWHGSLIPAGYGQIFFRGINTGAHRAVYRLLVSEIPKPLTLNHLCRVRRCVNPEHMEICTMSEATRRGQTIAARNAAATHCPEGHAYSPANTYTNPKGSRVCRTCMRERHNLWKRLHPEVSKADWHNRRARTQGSKVSAVELAALWTGFCSICMKPLDADLKFPHLLSKSIDHIVPLSKGGAHAIANLAWAHLSCNSRKCDRV